VNALRDRIAEAVRAYVGKRADELGKPAQALDASTDLFEMGVLDSVALTGLIAAVEGAIGYDIDFVRVDPAALGTIGTIVEELARAVESDQQP